MNKITVIAITAASFFAGICIGQIIGNNGGFGCNNGNTFINNYGKDDDEYEETDETYDAEEDVYRF